MICDICGCLVEDCECAREEDGALDFGDDERVWVYDGDCLSIGGREMKLYMVELTTYAVVLAKDEQDAIRVADCCVAEICGDNYPEAWHAREIQSEDDLSDGWNPQCLPYNGDGSTRISDYLKEQRHGQ